MPKMSWKARALALEHIVKDLHWMSRRYAQGRSTYATSVHNAHTKALLAMGVELNPTGDHRIFADDAMGHAYDGLTEADLAMEQDYCGKDRHEQS
jgi:hypothetical protein